MCLQGQWVESSHAKDWSMCNKNVINIIRWVRALQTSISVVNLMRAAEGMQQWGDVRELAENENKSCS